MRRAGGIVPEVGVYGFARRVLPCLGRPLPVEERAGDLLRVGLTHSPVHPQPDACDRSGACLTVVRPVAGGLGGALCHVGTLLRLPVVAVSGAVVDL